MTPADFATPAERHEWRGPYDSAAAASAAGKNAVRNGAKRYAGPVRRPNDSDDWYVLVTWPNGEAEHVSGFSNALEAKDWIKTQSQSWLKARTARGNG